MSNTANKGKGRSRLVIGLIIMAVIVVFAMRFASLGRTETPASIESVQAEMGKPVEVVALDHSDLEIWTTVAGTVEGVVQYAVVSSNALRVAGIPVNEGDAVRTGDVIVRLAHEAPTPMVHSYQKSRASYENTLKDVQRLRSLFAAGAISEQALDQAETQLRVAEADLADAEGSTSLVANQSGVVSRVLIRENETAGAGMPLVWITRTDSVKVVFEAGSQQAITLREGQRAQWTSQATGLKGEGRIERIDLMADPQTHLLEGEALFPNPDGLLVPGLLMSVRVLTDYREEALALPRECVMTDANGSYVYVAEKQTDGSVVARQVAVQTGLVTPDAIEIASGPTDGDQIIRYGQSKISSGDRVHIVKTGEEN